MSLIHWWPLNGDTKDYGINYTDLTNSNGTVNNNGKIGKCYYLSHSAGFTGAFNVRDLMSGACSFSLWLKIPETEYKARVNAFSYDSDHILMNSRIFGTSGSYSNTGLCLALQTNNIYSNGSFTGIKLCMGWRDANSASVWAEYASVTLDTWYHVVITKDSDRKMCMYVNGTKVAGPSTATAGTFSESNFYINTSGVWGSGNYRNSNAPMYINDFRIYDHALSLKEIKELSKGLCLHYTFEDEYAEPTINLGGTSKDYSNCSNGQTFTNPGAWGGTTGNVTVYHSGGYNNYPYKLYHRTNASGGGFYYKTANDIVIEAGKTYTVSCYMKCSQNVNNFSAYSFNINRGSDNYYINYGQSFNLTTDWKRLSFTFTATSAQAGNYGEMSIIYGGTDITSNIDVYYSGFQIEEKDHATPYTSSHRYGNLISTVEAGGRTVKDSAYAIHTNGTDSDTYFYINFNKNMGYGEKYLITCDVSGFDDTSQYWDFPICSQAFSDNVLRLHNGKCSAVFEYKASQWTTLTKTILDDSSFSSGVRSKTIYITNIKVTEIPYIYDNSGYENNAIQYGSLQISSDSTSGKYSGNFNGSDTKLTSPFTCSTFGNDFTISAWLKSNVNNGGYLTAIGNEVSNGGIVFGELTSTNKLQCYLSGTNGADINICAYNSFAANTWYHVVYTVKNALSTPDASLYINGELVQNKTGTAAFGEPASELLYIGCNKSYRFWNGLMSDIKIFATALSADDVKAEYNRKAAIDKSGNLFTGEIIEQGCEELLPGTHIASDANQYRQSGNASRLTQDTDGSMVFTDVIWTMTPKFPVKAGEVLYWDITYSNTSGNQFYVGFEQFDSSGNSGSNELCSYVIGGDTAARDHYRVKGTITVRSTAENGNPISQWRLRILNAWNGSSSSKIAKIHHISLRRISILTQAKIDKSNFVLTNTFREDEQTTQTSFYKNGIVGVHDIYEI